MAEESKMAAAPVEPIQRDYYGCSPIQSYDLEQKLGEGTFGEVYRARSKKNGQVYALKKILMHNEKDGFPITALREIKLLKMLSHSNIIRLEEMAVERFKMDPHDKTKKRAVLYMVFPYMHHDLSGLLDNPEVKLSEAHIKCYMQQLLQGLKYLHNSKILHRDMKAANLLINNRGNLQIADFGLARNYDEPPPQKGKGNGPGDDYDRAREYTCLVVTRWYRPPELLLLLRKYTPAIDMWGAGCVFGEMFKRKPILTGKTDMHQAEIIWELVGSPSDDSMPGWQNLPGCDGVKTFAPRKGNINQAFSELGAEALNLLKRLLTLDWRKRINAIDALDHPYFTTRPLPAKPEDIPWFQDSHELDRRNARGTQQALPPAPAGGTVGGGANGDWPSQANGGGWRFDDRRRGPPYERDSGYNGPRMQHEPGSRVPGAYDDRGPPPRRPAWPDDRQRGANAHAQQGQRHPLPPHEPPPFHRNKANVDTYVPSYADGARRDDRVSRERDDGPPAARRGDDRDRYPRDDRPPPRDREGRRGSWEHRDWDRDRGYVDRDRAPPGRARDRRTLSRSRSPRRDRDYRDGRYRERDYRR